MLSRLSWLCRAARSVNQRPLSRDANAASHGDLPPKRIATLTIFAVGIVAAILMGFSYWLVSLLIQPNEPTSIYILYRYEDTDYLPLIYSFARFNFHEFVVRELSGSNLLPFPALMMLPYASMIALFSDWGFAVADTAVMMTWFVVFLLFARIFTKNFQNAVVLAVILLVAAGPLSFWLLAKAGLFFPQWELGIQPVWDFRYPRPYISGLFMVGLVLTTRALAADLLARRVRLTVCITHGVLLGGSAQGDLHLAIIGCFVTGAVSFLICTIKRGDWQIWARTTLVISLAFALSISPLVAESASASPDLLARWGMFPVDRLRPPFYFDQRLAVTLAVLLLVWWITAALARRNSREGLGGINLLVAIIVLFVVFSQFALPLSAMVIGKAIQVDHFYDRGQRFLWLACVALFAMLIRTGSQMWQRSRLFSAASPALMVQAPRALLLASACILGIGSCVSLAKWRVERMIQPRVFNSGWPAVPTYRTNFETLLVELGRSRYRGLEVLGTFDQQLAMWWLSFRHGFLYVPDTFLSTVADTEIEWRTIALLKMTGADAGFFVSRLNDFYFYTRFLTAGKWQATPAYTYGKLSDYSPDQLTRMEKRRIIDTWYTEIPMSERKRLLDDFQHQSLPSTRPDVIVLPNDGGYENLAGPAPPYRLTYENTTFRVWIAQSPH